MLPSFDVNAADTVCSCFCRETIAILQYDVAYGPALRAGEVTTSLPLQGSACAGLWLRAKSPTLATHLGAFAHSFLAHLQRSVDKPGHAHLAATSYRNRYDCDAAGALASAHTRHRHH